MLTRALASAERSKGEGDRERSREEAAADNDEQAYQRCALMTAGQHEMPLLEMGLLDSGASSNTRVTSTGICNGTTSGISFQGISGLVAGGVAGTVHMYICDQDDTDTGISVSMKTTHLPGSTDNLISLYQLQQEHGLVYHPGDGDKGWLQRPGSQECVPVYIDHQRRLYVIYFTTGRTAAEAKEKAAVASGMRQRRAINLCVPTLYKVVDGMMMAERAQWSVPDPVPEDDEAQWSVPESEDEQWSIPGTVNVKERWQGEPVLPEPDENEMCYPCAHYGHSEGFNPLAEDVNPLQRGHVRHKKGHLSKEDLFEQHRRSGHTTFHPGCRVCAQMRRKDHSTPRSTPASTTGRGCRKC